MNADNFKIGDRIGAWQVVGTTATHITARRRIDGLETNLTRPPLELFEIRVGQLADRVAVGEMRFLDAVDLARDAAEWSGLIDAVGDDVVQKILAECFVGVAREGGNKPEIKEKPA